MFSPNTTHITTVTFCRLEHHISWQEHSLTYFPFANHDMADFLIFLMRCDKMHELTSSHPSIQRLPASLGANGGRNPFVVSGRHRRLYRTIRTASCKPVSHPERKNMESVFSYWKESFLLFRKDNLKTFVLGSLKTYFRVFMFLCRQQWLIFPWIVIHMLGNLLISFSPRLILATQLLDLVLLYVVIMELRPSIEAKDQAYYLKYIKGFWALGLAVLMNVFAFFPLLFFFDSAMSLKDLIPSIRRSLLACIYFAPTLITIHLLLAGAFWATSYCNTMLISTALRGNHLYLYGFLFGISNVTLLFCLSLATVCYIKIKHEHFDLFFT